MIWRVFGWLAGRGRAAGAASRPARKVGAALGARLVAVCGCGLISASSRLRSLTGKYRSQATMRAWRGVASGQIS